MMQTLNPYTATTTSKTAEIMARYRPIAPKPDLPMSPAGSDGGGEGDQNPSSMSPNIRQSPYLRNVWPHLQARPTRTRKRGRTSLAPSPSVKRSRACLQGLSPSFQVTSIAAAANSLSLQGFAHCPNGLIPQLCPLSSLAALNVPGFEGPTLVTLPLLPCLPTNPMEAAHEASNILDCTNCCAQIPEEKDLLAQLQGPSSITAVISPRPIRPVGSSINVWNIKEDDSRSTHALQQIMQQKAEEVEEEVESEALPAFVSDSNNRVRLVSSAYKEMVGQPECQWLDSMVASEGGVACKRICGEVTLHFAEPLHTTDDTLVSSNGFSCSARVEWRRNGEKVIVNAFCEVTKLTCEPKDYLFAWRLHLKEASNAASNV